MADARRLFPDFDVTRSWLLDAVPALSDEDLEAYLRRLGFSETQLAYTQRGFAGAAGEAMRNLSAQASLDEMHDNSAGEGDYRILDGYDALLRPLASGIDLRLNTAVERVAWREHHVTVTTAGGEVFAADQVVITLPLGVLKASVVQFEPELPAAKRAAIERLGVAPVLKLIYRFAEPILPDGVMALYSALNPCMWWSPSFGQPSGDYVLTAFVTADRARELLALGEAGALAKGIETLQIELDRRDLQPLEARMVNWVEDAYSRGGYSFTPPGAIEAHDALAQPLADTLFWAGEATAGHVWKATVHGAYASGLRAAHQLLSVLAEKETRQV